MKKLLCVFLILALLTGAVPALAAETGTKTEGPKLKASSIPQVPKIPSIPPVPVIPSIPPLKQPEFPAKVKEPAIPLPFPDTGEIWRADELAEQTELTVKVSQDDEQGMHIKIYRDGTELVTMLFVGGSGSVTTSLPAGSYTIKAGTGRKWYGPEESFGDSGSYEVMTFDGGASEVGLQAGYAYTLSVNVESLSPDADSVGSRRTTHAAF